MGEIIQNVSWTRIETVLHLKLFAGNLLNVQELEMFGYMTVFIYKGILCTYYKWCFWWICYHKDTSLC